MDDNSDTMRDEAASAAAGMNDAAQTAADTARRGAEQARDAFQDHVVEPARRAGEAMKASGQRIADSGVSLGTKVIDQAETNAREAFTAMRAAANAKDITEIMRIQTDFLCEQGQRSLTQAREIGEMIVQFGRDATSPLRGNGESPLGR